MNVFGYAAGLSGYAVWLARLGGASLSLAAGIVLYIVTTELLPREDRSMLMMRVSAPQGVSLDYTRDRIQQVEEKLQPLIDSGEINVGPLVMMLFWLARHREELRRNA